MTTVSQVRSPRSAEELATVALLALIGVAQVRYQLLDSRLPYDPGLYHAYLPAMLADLQRPFEASPALWLAQPTGWFDLLIALGMSLFGRRAGVVEAFGTASALSVYATTALIAHRGWGARAALLTTLLLGAVPMLLLRGRIPWVHVPEAALVLGAVAAWQSDPRVLRPRTVLLIAVLGMAASALRPTGLLWMAPLLLTLRGWGGAGNGRPPHGTAGWRRYARVVFIVLAWLEGSLVHLGSFEGYLSSKLGARAAYAQIDPTVWSQLEVNLGLPVLLCLGIAAFGHRGTASRAGPLPLVLAAWMALAALLWLVFRAPVDNHILLAPAAALAGGVGLSRLGRGGIVAASGAFLLVYLPQWVSAGQAAQLPNLPLKSFHKLASPESTYRPWRGAGATELRALVEASCGGRLDTSCWIVSEVGFLEPDQEDWGQLEAFFLRVGDEGYVSLANPDAPLGDGPVAALVETRCPADAPRREHGRDTRPLLMTLRSRHPVQEVGCLDIPGRCVLAWSTPSGRLPGAEALLVPCGP